MHQGDIVKERVLRISPEPCAYLDERTVHGLLTDNPLEYYGFVRSELTDIAAGRALLELPPKQIFSDPDSAGDFRVMPCVVRSASGARKTVKLVGTNVLQNVVPGQITVGKVCVIHPLENFVSHIFEACLLSSARTGICAALAVDLLAGVRNRVMVIGAGRVGYYAALYTAALGGVSEILLADIDPGRAAQAADLLSLQFPGMRFKAAACDEVSETDVLILATTSEQPVCSPSLSGARLIISTGADTDFQSELDSSWAGMADLFVDTHDSARFGDLAAWKKAGLISGDELTDLFSVLNSGAPASSGRPRIFISTGSALFDNLTVGYLLHRLRSVR